MKNAALAALVSWSIILPTQAISQKRTPKPQVAKVIQEPPVCTKFMSDYENFSKLLGRSQADEVVDNSASRSTMREAQNNTTISQARMTLDLMKGSGCNLPTFAPSASRYGMASLKCSAALQAIRARKSIDRFNDVFVEYPTPAECNTTTWSPDS